MKSWRSRGLRNLSEIWWDTWLYCTTPSLPLISNSILFLKPPWAPASDYCQLPKARTRTVAEMVSTGPLSVSWDPMILLLPRELLVELTDVTSRLKHRKAAWSSPCSALPLPGDCGGGVLMAEGPVEQSFQTNQPWHPAWVRETFVVLSHQGFRLNLFPNN